MSRKATQTEPDLDRPAEQLRRLGPIQEIEHIEVTGNEAIDLIRWMARVIIVRNANGRRSDKFCRCCQQSRLLKEPCRHADVWRIAGIRPE